MSIKILTYHDWLDKYWKKHIQTSSHFSNLLKAHHHYSAYYYRELKKHETSNYF